MQRFPLDRMVATPGALEALDPGQLLAIIRRHAAGDWGHLDHEDRAANEAALRRGTRLLSAYALGVARVWVITEADRSATTVLLPEEF